MKPNEAFNPIHIGLLGADAVMLHPQAVAHPIEQFGRPSSEVPFFHFFGCYHFLNPLRTMDIFTIDQIIHLDGAFPGEI
jgi:hypothetical protein